MKSYLTQPFLKDLCTSDNAILLGIDFQPKVFEKTMHWQSVRKQAGKMLRLADLFQVPTILCEQYPEGLGGTDPQLLEVFEQLECDKELVTKTSFGSCGEPRFMSSLEQKSSTVRKYRHGMSGDVPVDIIVMGIETHICVLQTVLELLHDQDYRLVLLDDCMTGRSERQHQLALNRLVSLGAIVTGFESVAFEWTRSKNHRHFKAMSQLVRE